MTLCVVMSCDYAQLVVCMWYMSRSSMKEKCEEIFVKIVELVKRMLDARVQIMKIYCAAGWVVAAWNVEKPQGLKSIVNCNLMLNGKSIKTIL